MRDQNSETVEDLRATIRRHVRYSLGREETELTGRELFAAVAFCVRDHLLDGMLATEGRYRRSGAKRMYYLSMEFLMGRLLENNLLNLGLRETCRQAVRALGRDWEEIADAEEDAALGNGGLGRLAACFLDSLASLDMPGFGYGINYEFGLFKQQIVKGQQKERPDNWLAFGTPWEIERPSETCLVPIFGRIEHAKDRAGTYNPMWVDWKLLVGLPHDMPVAGFGGKSVNFLRLFSARSSAEFDMQIFNAGDYLRAVEDKVHSERVSKVLYPSDELEAGRELRLLQEYFLVACSLRDIVRRFEREHGDYDRFASHVAIQLNDTHPALAVAELMRFLVDEKTLSWKLAWEVTRSTFGYTNHTLLPEALERWPESLLARVIPRHLQIIHEINRRFLDEVELRWPGDEARRANMSIVEEGAEKQIRMANLAIVGSHSVNGVSELHSELVRESLVPSFYEMWPERFNNKTNGVTPRRWLLLANPGLSELLDETIGSGWVTDLRELRKLESYESDGSFAKKFMEIKQANKVRLTEIIKDTTGVRVDPTSMFDVQIKRIHEYKRQVLKVLHIIHEYLNLVEDGRTPEVAKTFIFAGKAAPGYWAAKQIIKLIHDVGKTINADPRTEGWLRVAYLPDYRVSLAERIFPASDLSEQISTAGMEASGTGNMKFALNGALTMGTLDGANVEIMEEVGEDNIYIFGLKAEEILRMRRDGSYHPSEIYEQTPWLAQILDALSSGRFNPAEPRGLDWLVESLTVGGDYYFNLADLPSYVEAQDKAAREYRDTSLWARKAILNVARTGKFSSDRCIMEYASGIWNIASLRNK